MNFKKILTSLCFIVPLFLVVIYFSVGDTTVNNTITSSEKTYEIYLLAFESGFDGTYEEWVAQISGDEVELRVVDTELQWKYVSAPDTTWEKLYEMSSLKGEDGEAGEDGEDGLSAYDVWLEFNPGKTKEDFFNSLNVYELWLKIDGNENKTIDEFYESLKGAQGEQGEAGTVDLEVLYEIYEAFGYSGTLEDFETAYENGSIGNLKQEYTVTFDDLTSTQDVVAFDGSRVTKPTDLAAQNGYEFAGWYYGTEKWLFDFYVVKENITLQAKFELIEYTISYDLDGGVNAFNNATSYNIENLNDFSLTDPTKYGYEFTGWELDNVAFNQLDESDLRDITLVATWEENAVTTYDVTFNVDGIEYTTDEVAHGDKLTKPNNPTDKDGYVFVGWYVDGEQWSFVGYTVTSDLILEAKFELIEYTISYDLDGGVNAFNNATSYNIENVNTITFNEPTKTGYEFTGWKFDNNPFIGLDEFNLQNITLVATWDEVTPEVTEYTVIFMDQSSTVDTQVVESGTKLTEPSKPTAFTGWQFVGWFTESGEQWSFVGYVVTENMTLSSEFALIEYPVDYVLDGGVNNASNPTTYNVEMGDVNLFAPTKTGYEFAGWNDGTSIVSTLKNISSDVVLTATWTAVEYNVVYVFGKYDSLTSNSKYTFDSNSYTIPTEFDNKSNYTVNGIYFDSTFTILAQTNLFNEMIINNTITLYVDLSLTIHNDISGNYVEFGTYNGNLIKWNIVIDRTLTLTLVADTSVANVAWDEDGDTKYESSGINAWLNNDFYNEAFTSSEQSMINTKELENSTNKINLLTSEQYSLYLDPSIRNNLVIGSNGECAYIDIFTGSVTTDIVTNVARAIYPIISITL